MAAIETKVKCRISDGEVVVYSSRVITMFAIAFGIVYVTSIAAILLMSWSINNELKIDTIYVCLALFTPFLLMFFFGNRQVIFSQKDKAVYRSYGFGRKELVRFSEIHNIEFVSGSPSYRIYLKSDPYGKGITLLSPATPKAIQTVDNYIMPALRKMVNIDAAATIQPPSVDVQNLKYYTRRSNVFTLSRRFEIGWNIFLLCLVAAFLYPAITTQNTMLIFCVIPPMLLAIGLLSHTRKFDVESRIFTHSMMFFYKKSFRFEQFIRFLVVRTTLNGMYNGTDVKLVFQNDKGKEETVKLMNIRKSKKIELFIQETTAIMKNI